MSELLITALIHAQAQACGRTQTIEKPTTGMQKLDGYFPLYWDKRTGALWLEIPRFNTVVLYSTGLSAGLGSDDIGLDRGESENGRIITFERFGPKVLMVQSNENFRSSSRNTAERRAVEDSFARSVLWGLTVAAETDGRVLPHRDLNMPRFGSRLICGRLYLPPNEWRRGNAGVEQWCAAHVKGHATNVSLLESHRYSFDSIVTS